MKEKYIRNLEKNNPLDGLLEAVDAKTLKTQLTGGEIGDVCYATWKESDIGIAFSTLIDFLMLHHFNEKIIQRCEYVRECWQNEIKENFKKTGFIYNLSSNFYESTMKDFIEDFVDDMGYEQKRFKANINPKDLPSIYNDFLIYLAICEVKYGQYNHLKTHCANEHLGFAKQINSKSVNQLKKYGTGDIDKKFLECKSDGLTCTANDIYSTINITIKKEEETYYKQALNFIIALLKTGQFSSSYHLKFKGKDKNTLPIKGLVKKPPHFFFANAIQFNNLHPLIEKYAYLAVVENSWYENIPDEDPAMPGTFAVFALGLEDKKYLDLVIEYLAKVDFEHQYVQEKFVPALVEKYGLNAKTHQIILKCITDADNFKTNKPLIQAYQAPEAIALLQKDKLNADDKKRVLAYFFKNKTPKELR